MLTEKCDGDSKPGRYLARGNPPRGAEPSRREPGRSVGRGCPRSDRSRTAGARGRTAGIETGPGKVGEDRCETDEEALIRVLLEREISVPEADKMSCRRYYEKILKLFRSADLFDAAHVLFSADRSDAEAFAAAVDSARSAITLLSEQPGRFPNLARTVRLFLSW